MKKILNKLSKYFVVGVIGIIVDNIAILFFEYVLRFSPNIATLFSAEIGNINNFFINDAWTFKESRNDKILVRFFKYHVSILLGFIISRVIFFPLLFSFFISKENSFISTLLANNISILLSFIINFTVNYIFTWRDKNSVEEVIEETELR